jgi:NAD(P) transhydrogenase subunit alpha
VRITILRESDPEERRVAVPPGVVDTLVDTGWSVGVESGAGGRAGFADEMYREAGAEIADDPRELLGDTDLVVKIHPPCEREVDGSSFHEVEAAADGAIWIALFQEEAGEDALEAIAEAGASALALERVPRITRAQSLDVLSSMAGIAGYRAVVEASWAYDRFVGARTTAAGSTPPADMLVIGAGVAGLSAIATGRDLGARVSAFDVRPAVREEVESLGADFLMLDLPLAEGEGGYAAEMDEDFLEAERDLFAREVPDSDLVVTTASIPGRAAPKLVTESMVEEMTPGSVIVDLAAGSGGNCELTEPGEQVERHGVQIIGYTDLTSRVASHASEFFGRNVLELVRLLGSPEEFALDTDDEVIRAMLAVDDGESLEPISIEPASDDEVDESPPEADREPTEEGTGEESAGSVWGAVAAVAALMLAAAIGTFAPPSFVQHLTVFVLACFVGWRVIWDVTSSLHTPLMSVTNAISGIVIIGGILQVTGEASQWAIWLGAGAMLVASINIFGGFAVTQRMLGMFRAEDASD